MITADVAVIGLGPAGLQAAIHSSRHKAVTVAVGKTFNSSIAGASVENYLGFESLDGSALLATGTVQAESFGCKVIPENVTAVSGQAGAFLLTLEGGEVISAKAVVLATGISRVKLGVPGEKEFFGKGVSYCASCDCNFYKGRKVAIFGNETEAAASAELMTKYASEVYWVTPATTASPKMVADAEAAGAKVLRTTIEKIVGTDAVQSILLGDGTSVDVDGVFIELGARSAADLAMDMGVMPEADDTIKVDSSCSAGVPGVFACGDVTGRPWQVAKAVGQGCVAGNSAAAFIRGS